MLPVTGPPEDEASFVHEIKWDGYRVLVYLDGPEVVLTSRRGHSLNQHFPELTSFFAGLRWQGVLDGEILAVGQGGQMEFSLLKRGEKHRQVFCVLFDVLAWQGEVICPWPWLERRALLEELLSDSGPVILSPLLSGNLVDNFSLARRQGWEGIVSKHKYSPYLPGKRSAWWRKQKVRRSLDGVVVGVRLRGKEVRSLGLGLYDDEGRLVFVGSVGSGFGATELEFLKQATGLLAEEEPKVINPPHQDGSWVWFRPHLVAEVEYLQFTSALRLRHPVFVRFRFDKPKEECRLVGETP